MAEQTPHPLSPQDCLVAVMIAVSASDEDIRTSELIKIQSLVNNLPVFATYDADRMRIMADTVFDLFSVEDGLDALFGTKPFLMVLFTLLGFVAGVKTVIRTAQELQTKALADQAKPERERK